MRTAEEAKRDFMIALPHFRHAMTLARDEAGDGGMIGIGIIAIPAGGQSGQIVARFNAAEFFEDLATLLGAPAQTEDDVLDAKAQQIVDMVRASGGRIVDEAVAPPSGAAGGSNE
jgi:hypothetical protein